MKRLSRTMLRGASGVAIGLPLLEIMGKPARAQSMPGYTAAGMPKRFIVWFTPNGTIPSAWTPTGGETDSPSIPPRQTMTISLRLARSPSAAA